MARMTKEDMKNFLESLIDDMESNKKEGMSDAEVLEQVESDINYFINYNLK